MMNGSQRKQPAISEITRNGSVVGTGSTTTTLLNSASQSHRPLGISSIMRKQPMRNFGDPEAEALSASTVEEQSMDTFSTDVSYRDPGPLPFPPHSYLQGHQQNLVQKNPQFPQHQQGNHRKKRKSIRSNGSGNTVSSSASSYRSQGGNPSMSSRSSNKPPVPVPERAMCLILTDTGDYIYPDQSKLPTSNGNRDHHQSSSKLPKSMIDDSPPMASLPSDTCYLNNDPHEDLQKINDGLREIFD